MKILASIVGCALLVNGFVAWQLLERQGEQLRATTALAERLDDIDTQMEAWKERPMTAAASPERGPVLRGRTTSEITKEARSGRSTELAPAKPPSRRTKPAPQPRPESRMPSPSDTTRATTAQSNVLQIADASKRDEGIRELLAMLGSPDQATAWAALRALPKLRNVELDAPTWRPLLLRHLESSAGQMRVSAAYALNNVASDADRDVGRYIALARADAEAAMGLAGAAMFAAGGKIEGELATLFEELIRSEDINKARDAANYLRGRRTTLQVHEAVADAWRRHQKTGKSKGLWFHILGQMTPMHRPILEVVLEILGSPQGDREGGLLTGRIVRNALPDDRPFAAGLAAKALMTSTSPHVRRKLLGILQEIGSGQQLSAVREFAENELVTAPEREQARNVAEALSRR